VILLLALCLPAQGAPDVVSTPAPPHVELGVVVRSATGGWLEVDQGTGGSNHLWLGDSTAIVWHLDCRVVLTARDLRPGVRVRMTCAAGIIERIEARTLGPLAMEAAVEEWVAGTCGGRLWRGLSPEDLAAVEALGCDCWWLRESASRELRARGAGALRALCWARHHGDAEIRARAEAGLTALGWTP
jgi:hypothetical protein